MRWMSTSKETATASAVSFLHICKSWFFPSHNWKCRYSSLLTDPMLASQSGDFQCVGEMFLQVVTPDLSWQWTEWLTTEQVSPKPDWAWPGHGEVYLNGLCSTPRKLSRKAGIAKEAAEETDSHSPPPSTSISYFTITTVDKNHNQKHQRSKGEVNREPLLPVRTKANRLSSLPSSS